MSDYNQNPNYAQNPQYQQQTQWPPMTLGNWIVTFLLMLIPIANIVLMFIWAFGSNVNPSKKTYFQAALIMAAISILLTILLGGALTAMFANLAGSLS